MNARKWAKLVDQCVSAVIAGRTTVEECLARHPKAADELGGMLQVAVQIRSVEHPTMPPEAKQAGLQKVLSAALAPSQSRPRSAPRVPVGRRPLGRRQLQRAVVAVGLILALLASSAGVALAAERSLPGETLYPVKLAREQLQLTLTPADRQPALHLSFAERRLAEIEALGARGEEVPLSVVEALEAEMEAVAAEVASETDAGLELTQPLADLATATHPVLLRVAATAPPAAQAGLGQGPGPPEEPPGQGQGQGPPEEPPGQGGGGGGGRGKP